MRLQRAWLRPTGKRPPNRPIVVVFSFKTAGCLANQAKLFKSDSLLLLLSCFSNHTNPPLTKGQLSYLPSFIYSISRRGVGCQNQPIFRSNASSIKKIILRLIYQPCGTRWWCADSNKTSREEYCAHVQGVTGVEILLGVPTDHSWVCWCCL